jgi:putative FmdB family regulatory protein
MPIFEYHCKECGTTYEKIVLNRDAPKPPCPQCGSADPEKLISAPGAVGVAGGGAAPCGSTSQGASCGSGGFR